MNQSIAEETLIKSVVSEAAVSDGEVLPIFHLLDLTTQFHSMAFAMMAMYVVLGFKQCRYNQSGIWNLALILCMFAYTIRAMLVGYFPSVAHVFNSVEYMTPVFFMICMRVNFDDDFVFGWVERCVLGTVGVLAFLFAIYEYIGTSEAMYSFQRQSRFALDALAVIWAYWCVIHTWSDDLVARRRLARLFFVAGFGPAVAAGIILYFLSIFEGVGFAFHVDMFVSGAMFLLGLVGVIFFVDVGPGFLGGTANQGRGQESGQESDQKSIKEGDQETLVLGKPTEQADKAEGAEQAEQAEQKDEPLELENTPNLTFLNTLEQITLGQSRFKEMGMTLATLAQYVQVPEYRLRAVINGDLGYRNFNAYLNHYRVRCACELLAEPGNRDSILDISMECGYKSLSTFNKAFKDITSLTPSEYRKKRAS
ncbi:hypothetical protein A9Q81_22685 [Gammaproteobacteria bacterium 42_54_T18]|nr:hypothetical protein A9Q81_22685 [Gammaproteobacteria bacterium 42_54_T18]